MTNYVGTDSDDTIVATYAAGFTWGDNVDGKGGNDRVTLSPGVTFVSGPGNDTITGVDGGSYALWPAVSPAVVNLAEGWAQDGFGGMDSLSGITEVHMSSAGGTVIGAAAAETVFCFGGNASIDLGGGNDTVRMWELNSADYTIRQFGNTVHLVSADETIELKNVETLAFSNVSVNTSFRQEPYFAFQYESYSFIETQRSEGWWYAGVYNQPQLIQHIPQGVGPIDIDADGDLDLVVPVSKGYRTGIDTRVHFQVLENVNGELLPNDAMTQATPFIAGSRRLESIFIERYGSDAFVSIAHDTTIETETRTDIPWRFGDIAIVLADPFQDITSELVPADSTPRSQVTGRDTAVDAHSMGVGDVNGDGMDDILVGDWSQPFFLLQTATGAFTYRADAFMHSLAQGWREPTLGAQATPGLLIDMHLADLDGDGLDDMVVGWGHATVLSRVFFNNGNASFSMADSTILPVSVYGASNSLHMKTLSADFDADGDLDLVILQSRYEPYYGGNYIQFLENDGAGNFTDATTARLGDPAALPDTFASRLQWTDFWQVIDFNGDGAPDIAGHRVTESGDTPLLYVNDGTGHFTMMEIPSDSPRPISWGDFDGDGQFEIAAFISSWLDSEGMSSVNGVAVYELETPNSSLGRAYDIDGNAGFIAKALGALFGAGAVEDESLAGIGLSFIDSGMSELALLDLALSAALPQRSDESVVRLLYSNVVGVQPDPATLNSFVGMIQSGQYTQVTLAQLALGHELNVVNIDLAGLRIGGLEYLPFGG